MNDFKVIAVAKDGGSTIFIYDGETYFLDFGIASITRGIIFHGSKRDPHTMVSDDLQKELEAFFPNIARVKPQTKVLPDNKLPDANDKDVASIAPTSPFKTFPACNWEEDYTHENGNYINVCMECKLPFKGHKRRVVCKMCAGPNWEELAKKQAPPDNKCAHAGCWGEGEMVGFARCMVKKVMPMEKEIAELRARVKELEDAIADMITAPVKTVPFKDELPLGG